VDSVCPPETFFHRPAIEKPAQFPRRSVFERILAVRLSTPRARGLILVRRHRIDPDAGAAVVRQSG
jgi:hypothetical protein